MKNPYELSLAIPSSLTADTGDDKIRTYKIGQIARALAINKINKVYIYRDSEYDDTDLIGAVLRYAEMPQYLRKALIPREKKLRFVGVISPLRTRHHPTAAKEEMLGLGEYRDGVVTEVGADGSGWVDLGCESPIPFVSQKEGIKTGCRVTVRILSETPLCSEVVSEVPFYWGYSVSSVSSVRGLLSKNRRLIVASRLGKSLDADVKQELFKTAKKRELCLVIGTPSRGISDDFEEIDDVITLNLIEGQGTETVRCEEAVTIGLGIMNYVLKSKKNGGN